MASSPTPHLPKEVAALVQHIELHRTGWWEKTIERLVLAAVWLSSEAPDCAEILRMLKDLGLSLGEDKLSAALKALENQNLLVRSNEERFRIPDKARRDFESDIKETERIHDATREVFTSLVQKYCPSLPPAEVWELCESQLLGPLVADAGASAYRLIIGESIAPNEGISASFLARFDVNERERLKDVLAAFLDPNNKDVKAHVSRLLHARFCVEAGGLPDAVIKKLGTTVGEQVKFRLFVDTNFLFSILDLRDNPSNAAARELQGLIGDVKDNLKIELVIMPRTIDEAKSSLAAAKLAVTGIPSGSNFTRAALQIGFSGMEGRFFHERQNQSGKLNSEDWFDPYLRDFLTMARSKGVELFNCNVDLYAKRQDVVDDILSVQRYEMSRPEGQRKSYQKVAHDMILWHFVKDQRATYIESPLDAQDWLVTIDFRLIGFDEYKRKKSQQVVPICVHPISFIQLLQFWVPRSSAFEEAMLGSFRLPFLFREFDAEAERTSLRILRGLGRFEGREDLSADTLTRVILDEGLRSRLLSAHPNDGEGDVELIRDALVAEAALRADAERQRANEIEKELREKNAALAESDAASRAKDEEVKTLKSGIVSEKARSEAIQLDLQTNTALVLKHERALQVQAAEFERLRKSVEQERAAQELRLASWKYAGIFGCVVLFAVGAAWSVDHFIPALSNTLGQLPLRTLVALVAFIGGHRAFESRVTPGSAVSRLWLFRQVKRFRKWLWTGVILAFLSGVAGSMYANQIQRSLDTQRRNSSPPPSVDPGPGVKLKDR